MPWKLASLVAVVLAAGAPKAAAPALAAKADQAALKAAVESVIARTTLSASRFSIQVVDLETGAPLFGRSADDLLNPASNVKLFTAAAALARLGPAYRFDTEFLADKTAVRGPGPPADLKGNLFVRGRGDPSLTTERLWGIVNELWYAGLRSVSGDLVLDDTWFDDARVGPGYDQEKSDRAYMAPAGALSVNANAVTVHVSAGGAAGAKARVEVDPPSDFFVVENRAVTSRDRSLRRLTVASIPDGERQKLVVWGRIPVGAPSALIYRKIDNPAGYFGATLKALMVQRGIAVRGKVVRGAAPKDAAQIFVHQSDSLDLLLKRLNKNSSNFVAEQLIKAMGAQTSGPPGSWPSGVAVVEEFLATEVGLPLGTYVMRNGSGLNDTNRFSAAQICRLLVYMGRRFPVAAEYMSSLGIAARDGTLAYRMEGTDAAGRLRAKTGTLENVTALSGYVEAVSGQRLAFAMMANDFPGRAGAAASGLDALGATIAGFGGPGGALAAANRALGPTVALSSLDELKARVGTYEAIAGSRDRRQLTFLRTAFRTERDPAVKAVVGAALYLIEPDDPWNLRSLLESFDPGVDVLGRLRQLARTTGGPTPLVVALSRAAAEGNGEALDRMVVVAAQAKDDEAFGAELLEPLTEVSRNAPHELIVALKSARDAVREGALDLLARALARAGETDHPFPTTVVRTMGAVDPDLAEFARSLDTGLSVRIAAEKAPKGDAVAAPAGTVEPKKEAPRAGEPRPGG